MREQEIFSARIAVAKGEQVVLIEEYICHAAVDRGYQMPCPACGRRAMESRETGVGSCSCSRTHDLAQLVRQPRRRNSTGFRARAAVRESRIPGPMSSETRLARLVKQGGKPLQSFFRIAPGLPALLPKSQVIQSP